MVGTPAGIVVRMSAPLPESPPQPRTLADQLRGWADRRLAALLEARPDLANPAPQDCSQLASRAGTRASVLRALDRLTTLELAVLDALAVLGGRAGRDRLTEVVQAAPDSVSAALDRLADLALVWGTDDDLRVVTAVGEAVGTTVSRLGPPAEQLLASYGPERLAQLLADLGDRSSGDRAKDAVRIGELLAHPAAVERLVESCDPAARAMLDHLETTGSDGASEVAVAAVTVATAVAPVEQLVARGLLLPRDRRHLAVPREVGLARRGGRTTREPVDAMPPLATASREAGLVDRAAAGAASELVHRLELLLDHWGAEPPAALRQGGLSVRDLRASAALLHGDERLAALHVELAWASGLLGQGATTEVDAAWLPTDQYDRWRAQPMAQRWASAAAAWLHNPRLVGLVGSRAQGKTVNALAPDLESGWLVDTRLETLGEVASLPAGAVLASGTGVPSVVARHRWLRPRRPASRSDAVAWALDEAAVVGVMALGGLATSGRTLLEEGPAAAAKMLDPLLPPPVDHVLVQADLTAVAPGPLVESLARDLAVLAQVESRGGATVYRFTEASVRHAFDVGWSATEVHEAIGRAAGTEVPQPLRYLVDDVARTFGRVRVGTVESFLRSDDEAALTELAHDPRAAGLRLRRIAPTVMLSDTPIDVLLPKLRQLGVAPVVEGSDGGVHVARRDAHRARGPRTPRIPPASESAARRAAHAAAAVTAIRAGDRVADRRRLPASAPLRQSPAAVLALLREAVDAGAPVWIDYVDNDGSISERVVDPQRVEGGWLRAFDHRSEEVRSYAVHRITAVRPLAP
ncbi:MAG: Putative DNA-binding protein [uncultured Nocardioidaceae bacterium]|uniref:DNA-binding protein n=1 Tax=uncultured Nocardioidaceae bacterium TaxID=253824 RepID=A0A6J4MST4_9ACTN|nr:MAG: Putative DNA-binding protein [uncultured Nocardioidaceae bacterium]